jgi:iron(III) transport system substrate-binding protein
MAHEIGEDQMHSRLHYFGNQDPGALVNVSGAAPLASSPNPELAQQFLAFLVGKEAQEALAQSDDFEYPLGSGVAASPELKPFAELDPPPVSVGDLGDSSAAIALLQDVGLL